MAKKQIPLPKKYVHVPFLTEMTVFNGNLGFQSISDRYERPCRSNRTDVPLQHKQDQRNL